MGPKKIIKKLQNMRNRNLPVDAHYMLKNHTALFSKIPAKIAYLNGILSGSPKGEKGVADGVIDNCQHYRSPVYITASRMFIEQLNPRPGAYSTAVITARR